MGYWRHPVIEEDPDRIVECLIGELAGREQGTA